MKNFRILFASRNRHKFREISDLLKKIGVELVFGADRYSLDVDETGTSYPQNAILKAVAWAELSGMPALADDSGIEVRALGWEPGIYSSRLASNDSLRNFTILKRLEGSKDRCCRYVAAFALFFPEDSRLWLTEGYCWGEIAREPAGQCGFGYDPIFIPSGYKKTFAELGDEVKTRISHRAVASYALMDMLAEFSMIE